MQKRIVYRNTVKGRRRGKELRLRPYRVPGGDDHAGFARTFAKITLPVLPQVCPRERLFRLIDDARDRSIIWIAAPAGAGKTSLMASYVRARGLWGLWYQLDAGDSDVGSFFYYLRLAAQQACERRQNPVPLLTPEYKLGLTTFARSGFRRFFDSLDRPAMVVFDDYHNVAQTSALHEMLSHGLSEAPAGVNVAIISRIDPPGAFARLRATGRMTVLGWDALRLTERETADIVERHLAGSRAAAAAEPLASELLHRRAHGWVAGLVLMLEQARALPDPQVSRCAADPTLIFDFFAHEVFRHTDPAIRKFLRKTAFLPSISVDVARALTGREDAERILRDLTQQNCFTVRHAGAEDSYQYHPLFRAFLIHESERTWTDAEIRQIKRRSAHLLVRGGDIEGAVALLQEARDIVGMVGLICSHAQEWVAQGRHQMVAAWLQGLPMAVKKDNPSVLYWLGICRLPFEPREAREHFQLAFAVCEARDDVSLRCLAWSAIVDTFLIEGNDLGALDAWLDLFHPRREAALPKSVEKARVFSYVRGLFYRRPNDPDFAAYGTRAEALFLEEHNHDERFAQGASIACCALWSGDLANAGWLLDVLSSQAAQAELRPEARIRWLKLKSLYAVHAGVPEEGARLAEEGLAFAERSGVHICDRLLRLQGAFADLLMGKVTAARWAAARLAGAVGRERLYDALYHLLSSAVSLREGEIVRASEEGRRAVELAHRSGMPLVEAMTRVVSATIHAKRGDVDESLRQIEHARTIGLHIKSPLIVYWCAFTEASTRAMRSEAAETLRALRDALTLGKEGGTMNPPWYLREEAAALYRMALDQGICSDYVRTVIARTRLPPPNAWFEQWPWPLKIYTLGRFAVVKKGEPLTFDGKAQRRPLDLLKAIIALGGKAVPKEKISATLWPEAEGDAAHRAFTTTLHRLRRLLGTDDAIRLQDSLVTLDTVYVWVDVWSVQRLLGYVDNAHGDILQLSDIVQQALAAYKGAFLGAEQYDWAQTLRERIRSKFLRSVAKIGWAWERRNSFMQAAHWYQRGIEIDPLAEDLYRRLMSCYQRLDLRIEAIATYKRCQAVVHAALAMAPSRETTSLYEDIVGRVASPLRSAWTPRLESK